MGLFSFFDKSLKKQGVFDGYVEYHCHVLPGVDDGIPTMAESLKALSIYESLGAKTIWLTPHVMEDMPNTTEKLRARFEELKSAYKGTLELHLAAEYMLDAGFRERLAAGDLLTILDEHHVLVETSYLMQQRGVAADLENIKKHGYIPILAHPERYLYLSVEQLAELRQKGVQLQMNLPALGGNYGGEAAKRARQLLKLGAYSYFGTDLHSASQLKRVAEIKTAPLPVLTR